jgi:hypothetical protein
MRWGSGLPWGHTLPRSGRRGRARGATGGRRMVDLGRSNNDEPAALNQSGVKSSRGDFDRMNRMDRILGGGFSPGACQAAGMDAEARRGRPKRMGRRKWRGAVTSDLSGGAPLVRFLKHLSPRSQRAPRCGEMARRWEKCQRCLLDGLDGKNRAGVYVGGGVLESRSVGGGAFAEASPFAKASHFT